MSTNCSGCGREVPEGAVFCPWCGVRLIPSWFARAKSVVRAWLAHIRGWIAGVPIKVRIAVGAAVVIILLGLGVMWLLSGPGASEEVSSTTTAPTPVVVSTTTTTLPFLRTRGAPVLIATDSGVVLGDAEDAESVDVGATEVAVSDLYGGMVFLRKDRQGLFWYKAGASEIVDINPGVSLSASDIRGVFMVRNEPVLILEGGGSEELGLSVSILLPPAKGAVAKPWNELEIGEGMADSRFLGLTDRYSVVATSEGGKTRIEGYDRRGRPVGLGLELDSPLSECSYRNAVCADQLFIDQSGEIAVSLRSEKAGTPHSVLVASALGMGGEHARIRLDDELEGLPLVDAKIRDFHWPQVLVEAEYGAGEDSRLVHFRFDLSAQEGDPILIEAPGVVRLFGLDIRDQSAKHADWDSHGWFGSIELSSDGRFLVFASVSADLVEGDTNGMADIFVFDVENGSIERVSVSVTGEEADLYSADPRITGDGRLIAFNSMATNLVPGDNNLGHEEFESGWDVYVYDRETGFLERVRSDLWLQEFSDDGRMVLASGDLAQVLIDRMDGTISRFGLDRYVGLSPDGRLYLVRSSGLLSVVKRESEEQVWSGRSECSAAVLNTGEVMLQCSASDRFPPLGEGNEDLVRTNPEISTLGFVKTGDNSVEWIVPVQEPTSELAKTYSGGRLWTREVDGVLLEIPIHGAGIATMSGDGRYVVFSSDDPGLGLSEYGELFMLRLDRSSGDVTVVAGPTGWEGRLTDLQISDDGNVIAYSYIVEGSEFFRTYIVIRNLLTGQESRILAEDEEAERWWG